MKRKTFLGITYAALIGVVICSGYAYHALPISFIGFIIAPLYFGVGYAIILASSKSDSAWPYSRCYGLLLWSLVTIHLDAFIPHFGELWPQRQALVCIVVDAFFLIRMTIGRSRKETGWEWQIYAMIYLWLPAITQVYLSTMNRGIVYS